MLDRLRKLLEDADAADERLKVIRKRMEQGTRLPAANCAVSLRETCATFADTAEYSDRLSNLLGEILAAHVEHLTQPKEKETICKQLLKEHYARINKVLANVQLDLDQQREIHIRPQQAAFPAERVQKVAHALEDPTVSIDTIRRRANAPVANVAKSFHDDYIQANAKFRAEAGLKCWIVRTTDGNCCKWCTQVAGRYEYGSEPGDVYRRHDNCGCTTIYENGRQRQDVWSKKKWEVPEAGAGAPKPTILTPAQGRELQGKHKPTVLTRGRRSGIIQLPDIQIGRSLGAKSKNYDIMDLSTGEIFHLVEGSRLQNVEVFCGKGTKTIFRDAEKYALRYGGETQDWQHAKGIGLVDYFGEEIAAELHWVQCEGIGRFEFFVKEWLE
ncbi:MAG: hypothetical protein ACI4J3_07505 [Oscillospiraceae bacterium]